MVAGPTPSSPGVTARMSRQARKDTQPEVDLRRLLHAAGLRYRVGLRVPGMPRRTIDVAFTKVKLAVFVDGCFWHGCPVHATWPASNAEWWADKIARNRARDLSTCEHLESLGWHVLRAWEHEPPAVAAERVISSLAELRRVGTQLPRSPAVVR